MTIDVEEQDLAEKRLDAPRHGQALLADARLVTLRQRLQVVLERARKDRLVVALLVVLLAEEDVVADRRVCARGRA